VANDQASRRHETNHSEIGSASLKLLVTYFAK
jgi:hypothetical protein